MGNRDHDPGRTSVSLDDWHGRIGLVDLNTNGAGCVRTRGLLAYIWRKTESANRIARWALLSSVPLVGLAEVISRLGAPAIASWAIKNLGWQLLCVWLV